MIAALLGVSVAVAAPAVDPLVYEIRHDTRRCAAPLCGGWWVRAVDRAETPCADGTRARWCYLAELDWAGWDPRQVADVEAAVGFDPWLVYGAQELRAYGAAGDLGVVVVERAWAVFPR